MIYFLVPSIFNTLFFPDHFQLSHRRHHMYHNHIDKDYSYPWYTPDRFENPDEYLARMMDKNVLVKFLFPFVGWPIYLYGFQDGSHFFPFANDRMWKDTDKAEYRKCLISTASVIASVVAAFFICGQSVGKLAYYYLAPLIMCGWWLITGTV